MNKTREPINLVNTGTTNRTSPAHLPDAYRHAFHASTPRVPHCPYNRRRNRAEPGRRSRMGEGVSLLTRWANFYVITGTAAATLTGLQFVVISLGAERSRG